MVEPAGLRARKKARTRDAIADAAISLFLADARSEVLPIRLWNLIENLLDVRAAAVSGVLIGVTTLLALVMERATNLSRHLR